MTEWTYESIQTITTNEMSFIINWLPEINSQNVWQNQDKHQLPFARIPLCLHLTIAPVHRIIDQLVPSKLLAVPRQERLRKLNFDASGDWHQSQKHSQ